MAAFYSEVRSPSFFSTLPAQHHLPISHRFLPFKKACVPSMTTLLELVTFILGP